MIADEYNLYNFRGVGGSTAAVETIAALPGHKLAYYRLQACQEKNRRLLPAGSAEISGRLAGDRFIVRGSEEYSQRR